MTHMLRCFLATIALSLFAQTPDVTGTWEGVIDSPQGKLRMGVTITKNPEGVLAAKLDVPDQGAMGLALQDVSFLDGVLRFALKMANASYEGKLNAAGDAIEGTWTQGARLSLNLKRAAAAIKYNRPQEPQPPFPYKSEDVSFPNPAAGFRLAGTLTTPQGAGPFPAVILITGSGPQNRDEEIFGHKPFFVLADHLTRNGIAVLRHDDRGVGKSGGDRDTATSEDFAGDTLAAWQYLRTRKDIDSKRIGLIGHSEGGIIAPMLAARNPEIAFLVLLAGPGVNGEQVLYRQGAAILAAAGQNAEAAAANRKVQEVMLKIIKEEPSYTEMKNRLRKGLEGLLPAAAADAQIKQSANPWFKFFLTYEPASSLTKVKQPILALNGEKDLQVLADQNLPPIEAALKKAGNQDVTIRRLPNLNHLFQTAQTGGIGEYAKIEETVAPAALNEITTWIRKRTGLDK